MLSLGRALLLEWCYVVRVVLFVSDGLRLVGGCPLNPVSASGRWV